MSTLISESKTSDNCSSEMIFWLSVLEYANDPVQAEIVFLLQNKMFITVYQGVRAKTVYMLISKEALTLVSLSPLNI